MLRLSAKASNSGYDCLLRLRPLCRNTFACYSYYFVLCYGCLLWLLHRATVACYDRYAVLRLPATANTPCCGCCYGHYDVKRLPAAAISPCCGCLLWPLRCDKVACCGHFAVLWLPATATTPCNGCLLRIVLNGAMGSCYGC